MTQLTTDQIAAFRSTQTAPQQGQLYLAEALLPTLSPRLREAVLALRDATEASTFGVNVTFAGRELNDAAEFGLSPQVLGRLRKVGLAEKDRHNEGWETTNLGSWVVEILRPGPHTLASVAEGEDALSKAERLAKLVEVGNGIFARNVAFVEKLVEEGLDPVDALVAAARREQDFLAELAKGETDRAKAVRKQIADRVWTEARSKAGA